VVRGDEAVNHGKSTGVSMNVATIRKVKNGTFRLGVNNLFRTKTGKAYIDVLNEKL
jgi:hypothetical protein